jgi:uncharacterized membrane protein
MTKSMILRVLTALLLTCTALAVTAGGNTGNKDNNFTAAGHGPDWQLEIDNSSHAVQFVTVANSLNYRYPKTGPSFYRATRTTVYRVPNDDHSLSIRVTEQACQDSETGKSHETTVVVILDGKAYYGCGDYAH